MNSDSGEYRIIQGTGENPITIPRLVHDLTALGLKSSMTVIAHSSLSRIGWVNGSAVAVILALEEVLTWSGTLVMPTQTSGVSDPALWQNPPVPETWWTTIRDTMPAYDPFLTPSVGMGLIPETFRKQKGVERSAHPHHSFAGWGRHAAAILSAHSLNYSLGEQSPLAHLYNQDAYILLLGVGHGNNTSLHLAEYRANWPGKKTINNGAAIMVNDQRQWVTFSNVDLDESDFPQIGAAFAAAGGEVQKGKVGLADCELVRMRPLIDFAVTWMEKNRL